MNPGRAGELVRNGWHLPVSNRHLRYPAWYLQHWHFLPGGYMSHGSTRVYDAIIPGLYNLANEHVIHERAVEVLADAGANHVIEAGCGTGRFLARARKRLGSMTGLDLSPYMLERAASRLRDEGVRLLHADAAQGMPGGLDAAVAMHLLGHLPMEVARRVASNMTRAVVPGGLLLLVEHRWHRLPSLPGCREVQRMRFGAGAVELGVYRTSGGGRDVADFAQLPMEHAL